MSILQSLEQAAKERGLGFVVIGGLALIEHGYARFTADFDLLVPRSAKDGWDSLLISLGYRRAHEQDTFRQYLVQMGTGWPIDLMLVNDATFQGIAGAARRATIQGADLQVVSLEHLLALKLHVLKQGRLHGFLKDFEDVAQLVQLNNMDLRSPGIRGLFLKYGNADLYGKICRTCGVE